MFKEVSFSWDTLKQAKEAVGYADFDFLKDQPYFSHNGALYCLDYEFAMGKLESAAIWRIVRTLKGKKGDEYLGFWGYVFEDYVAWLFQIYANPKFDTVILLSLIHIYQWIDLAQAQRRLRAALQVAAHEAILGHAQLQCRRAGIV